MHLARPAWLGLARSLSPQAPCPSVPATRAAGQSGTTARAASERALLCGRAITKTYRAQARGTPPHVHPYAVSRRGRVEMRGIMPHHP